MKFSVPTNSCPCGYYGRPTRKCICGPKAVARYL
ncbi:ATP-binding protein [Oscillospiraceae bacterium LCP25S3_E10]